MMNVLRLNMYHGTCAMMIFVVVKVTAKQWSFKAVSMEYTSH